MQADRKSADEILDDMQKGQAIPVHALIVDLWRRVDELERQVRDLQARQPRDAGA